MTKGFLYGFYLVKFGPLVFNHKSKNDPDNILLHFPVLFVTLLQPEGTTAKLVYSYEEETFMQHFNPHNSHSTLWDIFIQYWDFFMPFSTPCLSPMVKRPC